jgi:hypothetical protein
LRWLEWAEGIFIVVFCYSILRYLWNWRYLAIHSYCFEASFFFSAIFYLHASLLNSVFDIVIYVLKLICLDILVHSILAGIIQCHCNIVRRRVDNSILDFQWLNRILLSVFKIIYFGWIPFILCTNIPISNLVIFIIYYFSLINIFKIFLPFWIFQDFRVLLNSFILFILNNYII